MVHIRILAVVGLAVIIMGCSRVEPPPAVETYTGPTLVSGEGPIPGIPSDVEFADYWIRKAPDPDAFIMTPEQIAHFNRENPLLNTFIFDIPRMASQSRGERIRDYLAGNARYIIDAKFFVTGDIPLEIGERHRIAALMDTTGVPDVIDVKFGMILERVSGKLWPTSVPFMNEPGDNEFDQGMVATLDFGEPVALLHTSKDDLWCYVQNENFGCWIPSGSAAFGEIGTVRKLTDKTSPLVAIGSRVAVYGAPEEGPAIGYLNMGSWLPIRSAGNTWCEVLIPGRGQNSELTARTGYIRRGSDVSIGFLPYTLRNVYRQCFTLYGERYGWGGMYDNRDCSGYVRDIFRCFDIRLPRNSAKQGQGSQWVISMNGLDRLARLKALKSVPVGITLLQMPGHIMIYLGESGGKAYAIHSFWSWRESRQGIDITHRAARVAVTDLSLGEGSSRGAFIDRLANLAVLGFGGRTQSGAAESQ
jgi:hypothetical protein